MRIPLDVFQCQSDVSRLTDINSGSTPNACPILIEDSCEFFTSCSTETAPKHQHEALKDAIAKYLGFRPLMEIRLYVGNSSHISDCKRTDP